MTDRHEEESFSRGDGRGRRGKSYRGGFESYQKDDNRRFRDDRNYDREDGEYESSGLNDYRGSSGGNYGREAYQSENYDRGGRSDDGYRSRKGGYKNEHDDRTDDFRDDYGERRSDDRDKYGSEDYGDDYDKGKQDWKSRAEPYSETKYESHDDGLGGGYSQKNYDGHEASDGE